MAWEEGHAPPKSIKVDEKEMISLRQMKGKRREAIRMGDGGHTKRQVHYESQSTMRKSSAEASRSRGRTREQASRGRCDGSRQKNMRGGNKSSAWGRRFVGSVVQPL